MMVQTYYVSTGKKNAMYTLRFNRAGVGAMFAFDNYICNLAADVERAVEKAKTYVDALRDRIGETNDFKIVFDEYPDAEVYKRRGKLSVRDTSNIEQIEDGIFPFGKHAGTKIADAPDSYVLFFADKAKDASEPVMVALSAACMGAALERGLIAKRDQARAERAAQDALSNFIGTVGERRVFEGEVIMSFEKQDGFGGSFWINKVRCGSDLVCYIGSKSLGEKGSSIKFKATVKSHDVYEGAKSTKVSRPA